jgi:hypothetical protein
LSSYFPYDEDNDDDEVYDNSNNVTKAIAYASADLNLATLEYGLFSHLPFNFCGDWGKSTRRGGRNVTNRRMKQSSVMRRSATQEVTVFAKIAFLHSEYSSLH